MVEIITKILTYIAIASATLMPRVLGTTTVAYPFTFSGSGFTCNDYQACYDHCRQTFLYGGTGDGFQCQQYFPEANTTSTATSPSLYPTNTPTPLPTATPYPNPTYSYWMEPSSVSITTEQTAEFSMWQGTPTSQWRVYPIWTLPKGGGTLTYKDQGHMYAIFTPYREFDGTEATYQINAQTSNGSAVATITVKKVASATATPPPTTSPTLSPSITPTPTSASTLIYTIEPATATVTVGQQVKFVMKQGYSSGGSNWNVTSPVWSLPKGGGTITLGGDAISGVFIPAYEGTYVVKGTKGSYSAEATVIVKSTASTSTTPSTIDQITATTPSPTPTPLTQYPKVVYPQNIMLTPGKSQQFMLFTIFPNGSKQVETATVWQVVKGGGTITPTGVFTAGNTPGTYESTVRGTVAGQNAFATITITASAVTTESTANTTPLFTPTPISQTALQPVPTEVFKYLNERVDICLKTSFSEEEYTRFFAPNGLHADLRELGTKIDLAKQCMKLNQIPDLAPETEACLIKQLTQERFNLIYSNQMSPTLEEQNRTNICFTKPNLVTYTKDEELDPSILQCLEVNVGSERYQLIKSGSVKPTDAELQLGRSCFNVETNIIKPPLVIQISDEQSRCLKQAVGEDKYQKITEGKAEPTAEEKQKANACLNTTQTSTQSFLPPPPEQVPFVAESKDDTVINQVTNLKQEEKNTVMLAGKALPDTLVDIYLFSEPIVVTTKTDENGNWSYELSYHLPEGDHRAYTVIHHPEKGLVRSEVFPFGVSYAYAAGSDEPEMFVAAPAKENRLETYLILSALFIFLAIGVLILVFRAKLAVIIAQTAHITEQEEDKTTITYNHKRDSKT